MKKWPYKDPQEVLDYAVDWTARLDGDTISSVTWTFPTGITKQSQSNTSTISTAWITGGTAGQTYNIVCTIVTAGGRTHEETIQLPVRNR